MNRIGLIILFLSVIFSGCKKDDLDCCEVIGTDSRSEASYFNYTVYAQEWYCNRHNMALTVFQNGLNKGNLTTCHEMVSCDSDNGVILRLKHGLEYKILVDNLDGANSYKDSVTVLIEDTNVVCRTHGF